MIINLRSIVQTAIFSAFSEYVQMIPILSLYGLHTVILEYFNIKEQSLFILWFNWNDNYVLQYSNQFSPYLELDVSKF